MQLVVVFTGPGVTKAIVLHVICYFTGAGAAAGGDGAQIPLCLWRCVVPLFL